MSLAITDVQSVPEPPTLLLFALGLGLVIWLAVGNDGNKIGPCANERPASWIGEHGFLLLIGWGQQFEGRRFPYGLGFATDVH